MTESERLAVAQAICKSRTCEGVSCCQWPSQGGRTQCPVKDGRYDDAADAAIAALRTPAPALSESEREALQAIVDGEVGEVRDGFIVVHNPDATPYRLALAGVYPNLVIEANAILSRLAEPAVPGWWTEQAILALLIKKIRLVAKTEDGNACDECGVPNSWKVKDGCLEEIARLLAASPPAQAEPRTEKQMLDEAAERVARRSGQVAQAESREDIRNAALEEAAKLIEKDFGVQHPLKPLGVSMNFLPGCASRATAIRALKSESQANQRQRKQSDA